MRHATVNQRHALADLLKDTDTALPLIVADHRPESVAEAVSAGADLLVCGHTHRGQLWPFDLLTGMIFGHDYGMRVFNNTAVYVSSGAGTWGPPMRTTARPEIVIFTLKPQKKQIKVFDKACRMSDSLQCAGCGRIQEF
jgi:predicted MPP superfamily phosphohydrolase